MNSKFFNVVPQTSPASTISPCQFICFYYYSMSLGEAFAMCQALCWVRGIQPCRRHTLEAWSFHYSCSLSWLCSMWYVHQQRWHHPGAEAQTLPQTHWPELPLQCAGGFQCMSKSEQPWFWSLETSGLALTTCISWAGATLCPSLCLTPTLLQFLHDFLSARKTSVPALLS